MAESEELRVELRFGGVDYIFAVSTTEDELSIDVENKRSAERWAGHFTAQEIVKITQKTGNNKNFTVFVTMLFAALRGDSDTVFIDLITSKQLALMSKNGSDEEIMAESHEGVKGTRLLVLTYAVEFDRVHYPLYLNYVENIDPAVLQNEIVALRDEVERLRNTRPGGKSGSVSVLEARVGELESENKTLKLRVKELTAALRAATQECDMLAEEVAARTSTHFSAREAEREIAALRQRVAAAEEEAAVAIDAKKRASARARKEREKLNDTVARLEALERKHGGGGSGGRRGGTGSVKVKGGSSSIGRRTPNSTPPPKKAASKRGSSRGRSVSRSPASGVGSGRGGGGGGGGGGGRPSRETARTGSARYRSPSPGYSRSPNGKLRFDPTAWAKETAKKRKNTAAKLEAEKAQARKSGRGGSGKPGRRGRAGSLSAASDSSVGSRASVRSGDSARSRGSVRSYDYGVGASSGDGSSGGGGGGGGRGTRRKRRVAVGGSGVKSRPPPSGGAKKPRPGSSGGVSGGGGGVGGSSLGRPPRYADPAALSGPTYDEHGEVVPIEDQLEDIRRYLSEAQKSDYYVKDASKRRAR